MDQLESIRNKPMVELTPEEIDLLTTEEQRWVYGHRAEVRRREAEEVAARRQKQARLRKERAKNRIPF